MGHGREVCDGEEVVVMEDREEQRAVAWQELGRFHPNPGEDGDKEDGQRMVIRWPKQGW